VDFLVGVCRQKKFCRKREEQKDCPDESHGCVWIFTIRAPLLSERFWEIASKIGSGLGGQGPGAGARVASMGQARAARASHAAV